MKLFKLIIKIIKVPFTLLSILLNWLDILCKANETAIKVLNKELDERSKALQKQNSELQKARIRSQLDERSKVLQKQNSELQKARERRRKKQELTSSKSNENIEDKQTYLLFKNYEISSLWHITHKENVKHILTNGILSNEMAYADEKPRDISDQEVQKRREKKDPLYGRKIHQYAPLYIKVKNPMLYVKKNIHDDLCLIEVSLSVLSENNFLISDGNAASRNTKFYNSLDKLYLLPWEVLQANYWSDFRDGKRQRCAEVLIYPSIKPIYIKQIHCYSSATLHYLEQLSCNVKMTKNLFF